MHVEGIHPRVAQVASSHHRLRRQELVITGMSSIPLELCPQQAKAPWTKLMHEQMIRADKVTAFLSANNHGIPVSEQSGSQACPLHLATPGVHQELSADDQAADGAHYPAMSRGWSRPQGHKALPFLQQANQLYGHGVGVTNTSWKGL